MVYECFKNSNFAQNLDYMNATERAKYEQWRSDQQRWQKLRDGGVPRKESPEEQQKRI